MKVTNNGNNTYGVHVGGAYSYIKAGESKDLPLTDDELVQARKIEQLSFEGPDADTDEMEGDEKDALIAALAEYGVTKNRRSSVESLKAALAEAKAAEEESE